VAVTGVQTCALPILYASNLARVADPFEVSGLSIPRWTAIDVLHWFEFSGGFDLRRLGQPRALSWSTQSRRRARQDHARRGIDALRLRRTLRHMGPARYRRARTSLFSRLRFTRTSNRYDDRGLLNSIHRWASGVLRAHAAVLFYNRHG